MTLPSAPRDPLLPYYRPLASADWELRIGGGSLTRGYRSPPAYVSPIVALLRGRETWMSLTPMETESQAIGVDHARGHVAIFGLGLGWSAAMSALRPEVERVTVVERDPAVLAMHRELDLFARLPGGAGDKVSVVQGDALAWRPDAAVDVLMPDIWLPLVSDGRVDEVRRMHDNTGAGTIYFWGQELEIARHARATGRALDAAGVAATVADWGLPLIGPSLPDYPALIETVAAARMRDCWLPERAG